MSDRVSQQVLFDATPDRVFAALMDSEIFQTMTGAPAQIDSTAGGAFSCFGGAITGRNLEVVKDRRLVQGWRAGPWPEGVYSVVRFELEAEGDKTKVTLDQSGYPDGNGDHLSAGWESNYWTPMRKLFSGA